jgi:hypothetical protein
MNHNDQNSKTNPSANSGATDIRAGKAGNEVMGKSASGTEPQQGSKVDQASKKDGADTGSRSNENSKR